MAQLQTDRVVEPSDAALSTPVGAEVVVVRIGGDEACYFGLRGGAVRVWELIQARAHTADDIVAAMLREFDVGESVLRADVEATLRDLERRELIRFV